jgi:hypothetical protein
LYIRNLKYCAFNTIFRQHNIHLVFSTCQHKNKWILCSEKPVLNVSFQDFWCKNINNHLICFEKDDRYLFLTSIKLVYDRKGAIEKSPILLLQYWKNEWFDGTIIISYFGGINNIFADCRSQDYLFIFAIFQYIWICISKNTRLQNMIKVAHLGE